MRNNIFTTFWSAKGRASGGYYSHKIFFICFLTCSFIFFDQKANSQNLVPNWSFEDTSSCPDNIGQIDRAIGWSSYAVTPDYFNSCANPSSIINLYVPRNIFDFQYAKSGSAYAGFCAFNNIASNVREYIGIQLTNPLTVGQKYYASVFFNRVGQSGMHMNVAVNKLGLNLSTVPFFSTNPQKPTNNSFLYSDSIISDTSVWTQVSGYFIADSAYEYLSIGNFFDDSVVSYINYDTISAISYYFVDDVFLTDSVPLGTNNLIIQNGISIYPNPVFGELVIQGNQIEGIELYSQTGQLIRQDFFAPQKNMGLDVRGYSNGLYYLRIKILGLKDFLSIKFIVQH